MGDASCGSQPSMSRGKRRGMKWFLLVRPFLFGLHVWCFYVIVVVVAGGNAGGGRRVAARLSEAPESVSAGSSAPGGRHGRVRNVPASAPLPVRPFLNVPVSSRLPGTLLIPF
jgi:hypothetical protein